MSVYFVMKASVPHRVFFDRARALAFSAELGPDGFVLTVPCEAAQ